ncbi:formyltetrahydrofolate-dependent phosphoribosylglycinamide formyltransferase [Nitrosomonas eutropha]|uniref:Phosphoribosylglycinamide formyltransferase n=1 Tax=Nitrosomonas eutropha TaxID=916 RepID=A0A1I7IXE8_9PROT|nr:phosphoribosylglycinamide formyltransferase [Nitrosomonas eutropha]SFU77579.1 formyltetrahydrofolate-dependent phosphoribosylglycinamide formyltransferase [Nitrosomonas eutropha]
MRSMVILISGRGSNMQALLEAGLPVAAVISNNPTAEGLAFARERGIPAHAIDHHAFPDRKTFDSSLAEIIDSYQPHLIALAGFMRILSETFVDHYQGRLINIHPSLLPAFPGLDTHTRALQEGVKIHGCTVHFVTSQLDHGPIIIQAAVPVLANDTPATLGARVLTQEHRIYPQAASWFLQGQLTLIENRVETGTARNEQKVLCSPEITP